MWLRSYFWSVFFCIRTRNNSLFGHFSRSVNCQEYQYYFHFYRYHRYLFYRSVYSIRVEAKLEEYGSPVTISSPMIYCQVNLFFLILSWRRSLSCKNQFIDLFCRSIDWFLYHKDLRHEKVNDCLLVEFIEGIILINFVIKRSN